MTEKREPARTPDQIWDYLNSSTPWGAIQWKQQTKPKASTSGRNSGKFFSLFVGYVDAGFVRERLAEVAPSWSLTVRTVPPIESKEENERISVVASLEVLGVIREDIGSGRTYKNAATDAFKRAASRFGIGADLYTLPKIYVEMESDQKFAKPRQSPASVFINLHPQRAAEHQAPVRQADPSPSPLKREPSPEPAKEAAKAPPAAKAQAKKATPENPSAANARAADVPMCPRCSGAMWDNRREKAEGARPSNAPDFRCRDKSCVDPQTLKTTALWLSGDGQDLLGSLPEIPKPAAATRNRDGGIKAPPAEPDDDLPF